MQAFYAVGRRDGNGGWKVVGLFADAIDVSIEIEREESLRERKGNEEFGFFFFFLIFLLYVFSIFFFTFNSFLGSREFWKCKNKLQKPSQAKPNARTSHRPVPGGEFLIPACQKIN